MVVILGVDLRVVERHVCVLVYLGQGDVQAEQHACLRSGASLVQQAQDS